MGRRGHNIKAKIEGIGHRSARNQSAKMRGIGHGDRPDLIGDRLKRGIVNILWLYILSTGY